MVEMPVTALSLNKSETLLAVAMVTDVKVFQVKGDFHLLLPIKSIREIFDETINNIRFIEGENLTDILTVSMNRSMRRISVTSGEVVNDYHQISENVIQDFVIRQDHVYMVSPKRLEKASIKLGK